MPSIYNGPVLSLEPIGNQVQVRVFFHAIFSDRDYQLSLLGHRYQIRLTLLGVDNESSSRLHIHYHPVALVPSTTTIEAVYDIRYNVERSILNEDVAGSDEIRCQVEIITARPATLTRQSNIATLSTDFN